eukprot:m.128393 g.128393  ORF g.128393 m.128393 type:complete len:184 (-) comp13869_c3_seq4:1347-1898(-)
MCVGVCLLMSLHVDVRFTFGLQRMCIDVAHPSNAPLMAMLHTNLSCSRNRKNLYPQGLIVNASGYVSCIKPKVVAGQVILSFNRTKGQPWSPSEAQLTQLSESTSYSTHLMNNMEYEVKALARNFKLSLDETLSLRRNAFALLVVFGFSIGFILALFTSASWLALGSFELVLFSAVLAAPSYW